MENRDPEFRPKPGKLENSKKINPKSLSLRNKLPDDKSSVRELDDPDLRAKKIKNRSSDNSASTSGLGRSTDFFLGEKDDSLCDFRSPKKDNETDEISADFEVKPKAHKRLARKTSKPVVSKKRRDRDVRSDVNQPSIESSFFKPQTEVKTAFVCPVCFKSYKDATAQRNHMKSCAARNKISTNTLLDAVQLQEKQANERKALGLIAAPAIPQKKTISRKLISEKDPQLQLALALSMSLHEARVTEEIEDAHLLAGEPCLPITSEMTEERRETLQNFGFTTNKPLAASTSGKSRKKRPAGPTLLQTRTQEERERFLTVRIAEVLMGDEAITQALSEDVERMAECDAKLTLKSRLLTSYRCEEDRLWEKTQQCPADRGSYSSNLVEISPVKVKPESEIKSAEPETPKAASTSKNETPENTSIPGTSKTCNVITGSGESFATKLQNSGGSSAAENRQKNPNETSAMDLSRDWGCMLGTSYLSDVSVMVKGSAEIHAHKVVFWARCYDILSDVSQHDAENFWEKRERISWPDTEFLSAYAFLEYVYSGVIERNLSVFDSSEMLSGVRALARKYRLKKLFGYLRDKAAELELAKLSKVEGGKNEDFKNEQNSNNFGKEESSMNSVETDINSLSTACNDATSDKPGSERRTSDSDDTSWRNFKFVNKNEKENVSSHLVADRIAGGSSSFAIQSPATLASDEKLSTDRTNRRSCNGVETEPTDVTVVENLTTSHKSCSKMNDECSESTKDQLDEERCTSPDIFDDTISISSTRTYVVTRRSESDKNDVDTDIEVVSTASDGSEIDRHLSERRGNELENAEKQKEVFTFVSTRRRRRSFKPVSGNLDNSGSGSCDSNNSRTNPPSSGNTKGDMTLALEKARRLNAKTASDSDSDCDSVDALPIKRRKNPFRVNLTNNSSIFEGIAKDRPDSGSDEKVAAKKRHKLSIFEQKIECEAVRNPALFNLPSVKPPVKRLADNPGLEAGASKWRGERDGVESEEKIEPSQKKSSKLDDASKLHDETDEVFDLTQDSSRESKMESDKDICDTSIADPDLSMFSKYKKDNSHNSIAKYRSALWNISPKTSAPSYKDTDELSSSSDCQSSKDESTVQDTNVAAKYEAEVLTPEHLNTSKENDEKRSMAKLTDVELSDLEIDLSDFSVTKSKTDLWNGGRASSERRGRGFDSLADLKLDDTEFAVTKEDDRGLKKSSSSDDGRDAEYFVTRGETSKRSRVGDLRKSSDSDDDKAFDIYNRETGAGEMKKKNRSSNAGKVAVPRTLDADNCGSPSRNVDDLLEECMQSSQRLRSSLTSLPPHETRASTSNSYGVTCSLRTPEHHVNLLHEISDTEFDDIEFTVDQNSMRNNSGSDEFADENLTAGGKMIDEKAEKNCYVLESDSSNGEDANKSPTISVASASKLIQRRSKPSRSDGTTPERISRSSLRILKSKSVSENVFQTKSNRRTNFMDDSLDRELARVRTPPAERCSTGSNRQSTPQRGVPSENVTPLANYSAMKSPELRKELQKYGLKPQKRNRAKQLLRYIYNELHPLVPVADKIVASCSKESGSSSEEERPAPKRLNRSKSYEEMSGRRNQSECETLTDDSRTGSDASNDVGADDIDIEALENLATCSTSGSNDCESLEKVFRRLIDVDKSLHNKILAYEPLKLEELHSTLKAQGLKCKLNNLMDFLDEQCITFRTMANSKKSRTRRKASPKKNRGTS